ncbi:MAG: hypothetical protein JWR26_579 [Pedosphaera sp.]|nr:hypothetical protein [Pedosphaera sp.]
MLNTTMDIVWNIRTENAFCGRKLRLFRPLAGAIFRTAYSMKKGHKKLDSLGSRTIYTTLPESSSTVNHEVGNLNYEII